VQFPTGSKDDEGYPTDNFRRFVNNLIFAHAYMPPKLWSSPEERVQVIAVAAHLAEENPEVHVSLDIEEEQGPDELEETVP
jgi:hypothetical protein